MRSLGQSDPGFAAVDPHQLPDHCGEAFEREVDVVADLGLFGWAADLDSAGRDVKYTHVLALRVTARRALRGCPANYFRLSEV